MQSTKRCCASTRVCSENRKQDTNVLDGADFVRDVRNTYPHLAKRGRILWADLFLQLFLRLFL